MLFLFMVLPLAIAQMDFSVYEDVTYVKTNSVPDEIQKCLNESAELNYKEIKTLTYPENIIRETNILTHLYDNFWQLFLSKAQLSVAEICRVGGADFLEHASYMVKLHRQFLKNVHHLAKDGKCRVCDPMAYWFRLKLESYKSPWIHLVNGHYSNGYTISRKIPGDIANQCRLDVNTTFLPLKEVTLALDQPDPATCATTMSAKLRYFNTMLDLFYEVFLKDNLPVVPLYS